MPKLKLDRDRASALLEQGMSVRQVAVVLDVSTQAIYKAIAHGQVRRPVKTAA